MSYDRSLSVGQASESGDVAAGDVGTRSRNFRQAKTAKRQRCSTEKDGGPRNVPKAPESARTTFDDATESTRSTKPVAADWSAQAPWQIRAAKVLEKKLGKLFRLLKNLPVEERRRVLLQEFSRAQRFAFETWAAHRQAAGRLAATFPNSTGDDVEAKAQLDTSIVLCDQGSDGSSSGVGASGASDSESGSSGDGLPLSICDVVADSASANEIGTNRMPGRGRSNLCRGICSHYRPSGTLYVATVCFSFVVLLSRSSRQLDVALDHLVILTDVLQRLQESTASTLAERFEEAFGNMTQLHQELGLGIKFQFTNKFWLGPCRVLNAPTVHNTCAAVEVIRQMSPCYAQAGRRSPLGNVDDPWKAWNDFKKIYLDVCVGGGWCRTAVSARLAKLEADAEEGRLQKLRVYEQKLMAREDLRSRRWRRIIEHDPVAKSKVHIREVLAWWQSHEARKLTREAAEEAKFRAGEARASRAAAREEKVRRDARWREMRRADPVRDLPGFRHAAGTAGGQQGPA
eukprot:gnl/TRDRNA2_/TRDRNA2_40625_c0_seq1.p1 gnl/TRDRNA2_/TRDRNA2_40625_c0~~gnl/TRDRNA2_/TRDRNA2_40625_c0_seq1.p1  ORF type:complete len:542 (+),score=80.14 gnl/TRDRNA2_/TRDRNA2_40625_c0_seq1:84-1628(+)